MAFGSIKSNRSVLLNMKRKSKFCRWFFCYFLVVLQQNLIFFLVSNLNFFSSEAIETRHALHGIRWPSSNPKCLNVDFGTENLMEKALASTADDIKPFIASTRDDRIASSNSLHESTRERVSLFNGFLLLVGNSNGIYLILGTSCWSASPWMGFR